MTYEEIEILKAVVEIIDALRDQLRSNRPRSARDSKIEGRLADITTELHAVISAAEREDNRG